MDAIIIAPVTSAFSTAVPAAVRKVAEVASNHPYAAAAVGTVAGGLAVWKTAEVTIPRAKKLPRLVRKATAKVRGKIKDWVSEKPEAFEIPHTAKKAEAAEPMAQAA